MSVFLTAALRASEQHAASAANRAAAMSRIRAALAKRTTPTPIGRKTP